jgi:hypothetical protein
MKWNRIAKQWRENLVEKLQDRYGLSEKDARKRANLWLEWVKKQDNPALLGSRGPSPSRSHAGSGRKVELSLSV